MFNHLMLRHSIHATELLWECSLTTAQRRWRVASLLGLLIPEFVTCSARVRRPGYEARWEGVCHPDMLWLLWLQLFWEMCESVVYQYVSQWLCGYCNEDIHKLLPVMGQCLVCTPQKYRGNMDHCTQYRVSLI